MHAWHDIALDERIEQHFRVVIEIPKGSMMIELSSEDVEVLRESLPLYLVDFRREVAGTENPDMRHHLQRRQNALEGILTRLVHEVAA